MSSFLLAIDQGTTSTRAILVDLAGQIVAVAQQPITLTYPRPGWVNQDAAEIWQTVEKTCLDVLEQSQTNPSEIIAIGIVNQRETLVVWDRHTAEPVAPTIVWQSRQSSSIVDDLVARGKGARYTELTGLVPDAYFTATKLRWLFDTNPELEARANQGDLCAGTIESWLVYKLSGGKSHITDISNASRTMLFDIHRCEWSQELLTDLQIPRHLLPEVVENSGNLARTDTRLFGRAIPITGLAGDQQAALFGQSCFSPGRAKNTYGTGSFLLLQTGSEAAVSQHRLLTTIAWSINGETRYALEGSIFVTGAAVGWLRDGLGIIRSSHEIEALAASVSSSEGVVFVPALTGLGSPHWDPDARGAILGITRGTTGAHIARATLEAICFQVRDVLDAMTADARLEIRELRVDGGASANNLLMQMQSDLLGVPIIRPQHVETTALGAAYLAGLGAGVWKSLDEIEQIWVEDRQFEPQIGQDERDSRHQQWKRAVKRSLGWATNS